MTASQVVDWIQSDGFIGWLRFEPDFTNGGTFEITDLSSRTGNCVAGGGAMPDVVNQARSDHR